MRYDLAFVLCCCKSFLGDRHDRGGSGSNGDDPSSGVDEDDYYHILGISKDATIDDIKRAYKKQSLLYHPDKLLQRNITMTPELQRKFTNIKEAYDVLCHPNQREIYNVFGKPGIKFMEEPLGSGSTFLDPNVLLQNFAKSSVWDRSKIFLIFVFIFFLLLIQPILICIHVDHLTRRRESDNDDTTDNRLWAVTFIPLWIWNVIILLYHIHIISMGPIPRPEHIPPSEVWIDPLPMSKRIAALFRFVLLGLLQVFLVLRWDGVIPNLPYSIILIPYFVLEIMGLYRKFPLSHMRIVTVHDLEVALGKPFSEFTMAEKQLIAQRYSVVANLHCPEYYLAYQLKMRSKQEVHHAILRIMFVILLILQFDFWQPRHRLSEESGAADDDAFVADDTINYFLIFIPIFFMSILICCTNYYHYIEIRKSVAEKDPSLVVGIIPPVAPSTGAAVDPEQQHHATTGTTHPPTTAYGTMEDEIRPNGTAANHNNNSNNVNEHNPYQSTLTDAEREVLQQQLHQSRQKMHKKCSIQCFLIILLILFVCKCNGATFTSFYILLPFLLLAGVILCCIGCAIFGVTEVPADGIHFPDVVVNPTTTNGTNNGSNPTTTTNDHYMNAAELGTAKPNQNTNYPKNTSNNTPNNDTPIIIPLPPPTDVIPLRDNTTSENVGHHEPIDMTTTNTLPSDAEDSAVIQPVNESVIHTSTTDVVDPVRPVVVESNVNTTTPSTQLAVPPPSSLTDSSNDNIQPQINELD